MASNEYFGYVMYGDTQETRKLGMNDKIASAENMTLFYPHSSSESIDSVAKNKFTVVLFVEEITDALIDTLARKSCTGEKLVRSPGLGLVGGALYGSPNLKTSPQASPAPEMHNPYLSFSMDHVRTDIDANDESKNRIGFENIEVYIHVRNDIDPGKPNSPIQTIIVKNRRPEYLIQKFSEYWLGNDLRRWRRLGSDPLWIYCDLFRIFDWNPALAILSNRLRTANQRAFEPSLKIEQTHMVHDLVGLAIFISEVLRIQQVVTEEMKKQLERQPPPATPETSDVRGARNVSNMPGQQTDEECYSHMSRICSQLIHHGHTIDVVQQQFQNIIGLTFNMITIQQNTAVSRLSFLGFIFLPLSFVATIFGMTEFHGSPIYFPAAAIPTLILVGFLVWHVATDQKGKFGSIISRMPKSESTPKTAPNFNSPAGDETDQAGPVKRILKFEWLCKYTPNFDWIDTPSFGRNQSTNQISITSDPSSDNLSLSSDFSSIRVTPPLVVESPSPPVDLLSMGACRVGTF